MAKENITEKFQWGNDIYQYIKHQHELIKHSHKGCTIGINGPKGIGKKEIIEFISKEIGRKCINVEFNEIVENTNLLYEYEDINCLFYIENTIIQNGIYHLAVEKIISTVYSNHKMLGSIIVFSSNEIIGKNTALNVQFHVFTYGRLSMSEKIAYAKESIEKCKNKWKMDNIVIPDNVIEFLIKHYTKESGKNYMSTLIEELFEYLYISKVCICQEKSMQVTNEMVFQLLGSGCCVFDEQIALKCLQGVGIAWTRWGGMLLPIEISVTKGKGNIVYTGTLGDTMKESIQVIFSYLEINYKEWKLRPDFIRKHNFHIHIYEHAIYKNGASAGLAFFVKLLCIIKNITFKEPIGFTGEVSLEGRILRVGGLKEKLCTLQEHNIYKVVLPKQSWAEYQSMPLELRNSMSACFVDNIKDIKKVISRDSIYDKYQN